jgi:sec-independent protein translocase protein TatB
VFDMSLGEMLVIGVLVLVFFEPDQLPDLMRQAGRMYGKIKGASDDLRRAFNAEVARVDSERRREELQRRRDELARRRVQPAPDAVARETGVPRPTETRPVSTEVDPAQPADMATIAESSVPADPAPLPAPAAVPVAPAAPEVKA